MTLRLALLFAVVFSGCVRRVAAFEGDEKVQDPPPGMVGLSVYADPEDGPWTVELSNGRTCTTPCGEFVTPREHVSLTRYGERLDLFGVDGALPGARDVVLVAEGVSDGLRVNGIVFTTLGGMGTVVGIVLTAAGCSGDRQGMCTAGLITGGSSVALLGSALFMLALSAPVLHVLEVPSPAPGKVSLSVTPTGVAGTF